MTEWDFANPESLGRPIEAMLPGIRQSTMQISGHTGSEALEGWLPFRIAPHPDRPNMSQARPGDVIWLDHDGWRMHFEVLEVEPGGVLSTWPVLSPDMAGTIDDHALIRERLTDMVMGVRTLPRSDDDA